MITDIEIGKDIIDSMALTVHAPAGGLAWIAVNPEHAHGLALEWLVE